MSVYRKHGYDYEDAELSGHFANHMNAMTAENLHSKADIAWELAHRDAQISALKGQITKLLRRMEK